MFPDVTFVHSTSTKSEPFFILHKNQNPNTIDVLLWFTPKPILWE